MFIAWHLPVCIQVSGTERSSIIGLSSSRWSSRGPVGAIVLLALLPWSAGGQATGDGTTAGREPIPATGDPLLVWAAASTGPALREVHLLEPGAPDTRLNLDGTSRLALQLERGAPADVFISADRAWMDWAVAEGLVDREAVRILATNRLVLAAPADTLPGPDDLPAALLQDRRARIAIAGEAVPAGRYARQVLRNLGLYDELQDRLVAGSNVRSVLEWVGRGELPLGFVYRSDARTDDRVRILVEVPDSLHAPIEVLGAPVRDSPRRETASAYLALLSGPVGARAFQNAGFSAAEAGPSPAVREARGPAVSVPAAIRISVLVALAATLLSLVPAVGLGWALARRPFPGKTLVSAAVLSPLVIPPVVTGFLLLEFLGSGGPGGELLAALGLRVPFTFLAAVLAAGVVGFPLFVITVRNSFEAVDPGLEEMSGTLGARPWRTFRRVSLPLALPGIGAGAVLAFARALGEFGATVVLAGNLEGETRTIALAVYTLLEAPEGQREIWWLVGASVVLSVLALAGFEALSRRQRRLVRRDGHR